jgi:hypothetical protein
MEAHHLYRNIQNGTVIVIVIVELVRELEILLEVTVEEDNVCKNLPYILKQNEFIMKFLLIKETIHFGFFFLVLGFELRAFTLSLSTSCFFVMDFF